MPQENLTGRTVADYRLLERIGEGGTAMVYRAEHPDHGSCALKILKERMRKDPTAVKRFLREAGYGARVQSPSVVQTYNYGEDDGLYYLGLEWVEGRPLSTCIISKGRLEPEVVARIVDQLADALTAAHAQGIIHRDLKPENIMFDEQSRTSKLLDFGIARDAEQDPAERLTRAGFFVGTLQYVAPEALSGELVGESADIYSLAKITYYMLTGAHPHSGRSPRELFQQLLTKEPTPLNQAVKGLKFSPALEAAVMKALRTKPEERQRTVREFADDVMEAIDDQPASDDGGLFGSFKTFMRRKP